MAHFRFWGYIDVKREPIAGYFVFEQEGKAEPACYVGQFTSMTAHGYGACCFLNRSCDTLEGVFKNGLAHGTSITSEFDRKSLASYYFVDRVQKPFDCSKYSFELSDGYCSQEFDRIRGTPYY